MDFLEIDGGYGEGGGQIIRSAVALSCITRRPIRLKDIRRNRKVPGLQAQHLTVIRILQKISDARVAGAELGSKELEFVPGDVGNLELVEDVGTAGSISLILQALIPVVSISQKRLELSIRGGTDVPWSPPIDYTRRVLGEAYSRMGIGFSIIQNRRGYYPKGGGEITLQVSPSDLKPASFLERKTRHARLVCTYSRLGKEIEDQVEAIGKRLVRDGFTVESEISKQDASDSGASVLVYSIDEGSVIGVDSIYDKKRRRFDLDIDGFVGNQLGADWNLADMLVVPASLVPKRTAFRVGKITKHLETNLFVTSKITGCKYGIGRLSGGFEVIVEGVSHTGIKQGRKEQDGQ